MTRTEVVTYLAAEGPTINTQGVITWTLRVIIPLIVLFIVIKMIASASKANQTAQNTTTVVNVFLGLFLLAAVGFLAAFAKDLVALVFG